MTSPALRVVHGGEPTADEIAALVVALVAAPGALAATAASDTESASRWPHSLRTAPPRGRDGWLAAARRGALRAGR